MRRDAARTSACATSRLKRRPGAFGDGVHWAGSEPNLRNRDRKFDVAQIFFWNGPRQLGHVFDAGAGIFQRRDQGLNHVFITPLRAWWILLAKCPLKWILLLMVRMGCSRLA